MIAYRTNKYLIKPTAIQKEKIKMILKCCTIVYNKFIEENGFETYKYMKAKDILAKFKAENQYLYNADPSALMNVLFVLQRKRSEEAKEKPKNVINKSYVTTNLSGRQAIYFTDSEHINIPHLGNVRTIIHRNLPLQAKIYSATITINNINEYYVCITYSFETNNTINKININNSIGLDYSQQHLFVDSEGNTCNMKHYSQESEERIAKLKRAVTKHKKNSIEYYRLKNKIGKIIKRTVNQRNDYLHKLSNKLANKYDIVCVEDLNMKDMASKYSLAKNAYDNSYGKFITYLKYKLEDRGKILVVVDKYYPSSKICSKCGFIKKDLTLNERAWKCPCCGTVLDRDINAAINIKNKGIEQFTSIGYLD